MPKKGDNLDALTAAASVEHHGAPVTVGAATFNAIINLGVELIDVESGVSTYGDMVELCSADLPSHAHGAAMTVVSSGVIYKLQRTLKDDGSVRTIGITR